MGNALFANDAHALETLVYMRKRAYEAAKSQYIKGAPGSLPRLVDASAKYIAALEAQASRG